MSQTKRTAKRSLAVLIQTVLDLQQMTRSELARRSGLSPQAISTFLGPRPMKVLPMPATIQGLARGLGIEEREVTTACLEDLGFQVAHIEEVDPSMSVIVTVARDLTPEARERLARIARTFLET